MWRSAAEVDRPVWKHWLVVTKPDQVNGSTGMLFITGGSIKDAAPGGVDPANAEIAVLTHTVVAQLRGVPNEPLIFTGEMKPRTEDDIIVYTWLKFFKTHDESWPARLPMTKAAVRAMDTVTVFCASPAGGAIKVDRFFVTGASKRGLTTWTTAAADRRVIGIAPMVIDCLNTSKSFEHHYQAYGFYSPAVKSYEDAGIMKTAHTPDSEKLMQMEDAYSYRARFTMPKFIVNSAGDQYFLPDSSRFYFDGLPGEKYLRYVPNTDHSLKNSDVRQSLGAYYDAVLHDRPRPRFSWKFASHGEIRVTCKDKPAEVKLWQATNPKARDFRLMSIGPAYKSTTLADQGNGVYTAKVPQPAQGWTAYFVELTFPSGSQDPFKFTTAVRIAPDTLPFRKD
jgi:PhoPQ-activated pathogenicity-related protein